VSLSGEHRLKSGRIGVGRPFDAAFTEIEVRYQAKL
jgi:hypothetical protein